MLGQTVPSTGSSNREGPIANGRSCGRGSEGRAPRSWWFFYIKNRTCDAKMQVNANFCLKYVSTHDTVSRAKIAQSCVLANGRSIHRDFAKFRTPHIFLNSTLFRFDSTFWLDSTLKLNYAHSSNFHWIAV